MLEFFLSEFLGTLFQDIFTNLYGDMDEKLERLGTRACRKIFPDDNEKIGQLYIL